MPCSTMRHRGPPSDRGWPSCSTRPRGCKRIVLTTHRRESFGDVLDGQPARAARVRRAPRRRRADLPGPSEPGGAGGGRRSSRATPRIHLTDPLDYPDFIGLLSERLADRVRLRRRAGGGADASASRCSCCARTTERPEARRGRRRASWPARPELLADAARRGVRATRTPIDAPVDNPFGRRRRRRSGSSRRLSPGSCDPATATPRRSRVMTEARSRHAGTS